MNKPDLSRQIAALVETILVPLQGFLIDVKIIPTGKRKTVDIVIDTDQGITIGQCAEISRQIGERIDTEQIISDAYILQVSSPGLTKPLMIPRQYQKNKGRICNVWFRRDDESRELRGTLIDASDKDATFEEEGGKQTTLPYSAIAKCMIELPW